MKITILGSGSAYGSPVAGVKLPENVDAKNPKNFRTRSSIYLQDNGGNLLVECGPDFRQQVVANGIYNPKMIFFYPTAMRTI